MKNKIIILLFFSFSPFIAWGADVSFIITGEIINPPCNTTIINNDSAVNMGTYSTSAIKPGDKTDLIKFNIGLSNCPNSLDNIQFTFNGKSMNVNNDYFSLDPDGATNVGIVLYEEDKTTLIAPNIKTAGKSISKNISNIFTFYAAYIATGAVTEGNANATLDIDISYN
ncbi:fimbrial protein [Klebsiella sp. BIGb0407]|uniref:fimbrial protein n=1 Tax=Klebsiella sp. BIGb0407 TaxID=2940603 RepID=UPI002168B902|nr:fimbrial protein [Klebsiella sp. BIGb0407]MCS3430460.1 type 1 fimbria pilin [Klebsiella sp. BIGb0407]